MIKSSIGMAPPITIVLYISHIRLASWAMPFNYSNKVEHRVYLNKCGVMDID
jgi:hypothetical protein